MSFYSFQALQYSDWKYHTSVNKKNESRHFQLLPKREKRIEALFSQLCDQFMIIRNYAKDTDGLFARVIEKISALTVLQYINYKNAPLAELNMC